MADISSEIKNFREAAYGKEVRGSMISLAEKLNGVSEITEQAEKKRVTAETGRVNAEKKRQTDTSEAIKKNNEATERANAAASSAETAEEETNRATENANTKASLADAAAKKAESAAKSAIDAAESADTAKAEALEAAETATAEAGKATKAASNANGKAEAANTAAGKANTAADRAEKAAEHAEGLVLGDISEKTVTFEMAAERAGVEAGDSLAVAFGKLAKYCADLKPHAFAAPVNNLTGTNPDLALAATQGREIKKQIDTLNSSLVVKTRNIEGAYLTCNVIGCGKIVWFRISDYTKITLKQGTEYNLFKINEIPLYTVIQKIYLSGTSGFLFTISSADGQITLQPFGADIVEGTGINVSEVYLSK